MTAILLVVSLAFGLLVAPFAAAAQPTTQRYRVGRLSAGNPPEGSALGQRTAEAFRHGLRERGYVEGQNLVIVWRFAEGRLERLPELAAELVQLPVDVLVVSGCRVESPSSALPNRRPTRSPLSLRGRAIR